ELHSGDDDDDYEGDVVDDSIALSFEPLGAGAAADAAAESVDVTNAETTTEAEIVDDSLPDVPSDETVLEANPVAAAEIGTVAVAESASALRDRVVVDTGAHSAHDEVVAEPLPAPQP